MADALDDEADQPDMTLYRFPPMLGPAEDWPEGSPEWAERWGNRLSYTARHVEMAVEKLVPLVERASVVEPWRVWPKDRPCGSADEYFRLCTGLTLEQILTLLRTLKLPGGASPKPVKKGWYFDA